MRNNNFEGFEYFAQELSKYLYSSTLGLFTISLKHNGEIINFIPDNPEEFKLWLEKNNIPAL